MPHPQIVNSNNNYVILIDGSDVSKCNNYLDAIILYFSYHFIFNIMFYSKVNHFLIFISNYVFNNYSGVIPRRVKGLYRKL